MNIGYEHSTSRTPRAGTSGQIDRTEQIRAGYLQQGDQLVRIDVNWDTPNWFPEGEEHSIPSQLASLRELAAKDSVFLGAFEDDHMVGIAAWHPQLTDSMSQLAYLHVDCQHRRKGIASALCAEIDRLALEGGLPNMYVSATPSESTVSFYMHKGFEPTATPNAELFEQEPEDIHMIRHL